MKMVIKSGRRFRKGRKAISRKFKELVYRQKYNKLVDKGSYHWPKALLGMTGDWKKDKELFIKNTTI